LRMERAIRYQLSAIRVARPGAPKGPRAPLIADN
jgi:hypothetical protein